MQCDQFNRFSCSLKSCEKSSEDYDANLYHTWQTLSHNQPDIFKQQDDGTINSAVGYLVSLSRNQLFCDR